MANLVLISQVIQTRQEYTKYSLTWDYIAYVLGSSSSGNITIFTLPQGSKITGVVLKSSIQFTGPATTLMTSLGSVSNPFLFTPPTQDLIGNPVADNFLLEVGGLFTSGQLSAQPIVVNLVLGAGNFKQLTNGQLDIYVLQMRVVTPGV